MLSHPRRSACAPVFGKGRLSASCAQLLRVGVVLALLASVLALTSVDPPDAHAQTDPAMTVPVTVNITVPQVDDGAGDNIFSGRTFTVGLRNTNEPPQAGCTAHDETDRFDPDWATYTVQDGGTATTSADLTVVRQPADSETDCEYDVVFRAYEDWGSYVDVTDSAGSNPLSLDVVRQANGEGIRVSGGTGRLQIDPLPAAEDGPPSYEVDLDAPTVAATYAAPARTWGPKVDITVPDVMESGANKYATTTFDIVFSRVTGPATGCTPDTTVTYTVQSDGAVHIAAAHKVDPAYPGLTTPANDIAGPSLTRYPADSDEECTYTMTVPHTVNAGTGTELTMPGVEHNDDGQVVMPVTWADAAEVLDDGEYSDGDDPVVSTHRIRYFEPRGPDTFTPQLTITVPPATVPVSWSYNPDGNSETATTGTDTNRFVGRRLAVTFTPTSASPAGCSPEIVSFLVVHYDGMVRGPMPTLTAHVARNPSSGNGFFDPAHHYTPGSTVTPDSASRVDSTACEYTVTFPMGDSVLEASSNTLIGTCTDPWCEYDAAQNSMTDAVSGGCLLTPNPNGVDNNDCVGSDGRPSAEPASASPTSTVTGSRLRRQDAATATVTAASPTATAVSYTAPELEFNPVINIDLPEPRSRYSTLQFEVMFRPVGSAPGIPSLNPSTACTTDGAVTYGVVGGEVAVSGAPTSLIGSPEDYPYECVYQVIMPTSVGSGSAALALDHPTRTVMVGGEEMEVAGTVQLRYPSKTFYYSHPDQPPRIPQVPGLTGQAGAELPNGAPPAGRFTPDITFTIVPGATPNQYLDQTFDVEFRQSGGLSGCSPALTATYKVANGGYVYLETTATSMWEDSDFGELWHSWSNREWWDDDGLPGWNRKVDGDYYLVSRVPFFIDVPPGKTESCEYFATFPNDSGDAPNDLERIRPLPGGGRVAFSAADSTIGVTYAPPGYDDNDFSFVPSVSITVPAVTARASWDYLGRQGTHSNLFAGRQFAVTFTPTASSPNGCSRETVVFLVVRPDGSVTGPMPRLVDHPARNPFHGSGDYDPASHISPGDGITPGVADDNCEYTVTFPMGDSRPNADIFPQSTGSTRVGGGCSFVPDPSAEDGNYCYDAEGAASAKPASASSTKTVAGSRLMRSGDVASTTATVHKDSATAPTVSYTAPALPTFQPVIDLALPRGTSPNRYANRTFQATIMYASAQSQQLEFTPAGYPEASECSGQQMVTYTVGAGGSITNTGMPELIDVPANKVLQCVYWVMFDEAEARAAGLTFGGALAQGPVSDPSQDRTSTPAFASIRNVDPLCTQQELFDHCEPYRRTFRFQVLGEGPHRPPDPLPTADTFQPIIRIDVPRNGTAQTTVNGVTTNHFTGKVFAVSIEPTGVPGTNCTSAGTVTYQIQQDGTVRTHWMQRVPRQRTTSSNSWIEMRNETFELAPRLIAGTCQYLVTFPLNEDFPAEVPSEQRWPGARLRTDDDRFHTISSSASVRAAVTYTAEEQTFMADVDVSLALPAAQRATHSGLTFDVTYTPLTTSQLLAPDGRSLQTHGVLPSTDGRCTATTTVTYTVGSDGTIAGANQELIGFAENSTRRCLYGVTLPTTLAGGALELGVPQTRAVLPGSTDASFTYYAPGAQPFATFPSAPAGKFAPRVSIAVERGAQPDQYLGATFDVRFSTSSTTPAGCSDVTVTYEVAGFETVYGKEVQSVDNDNANLVATTFIQVAGNSITERTPWLIDVPASQPGGATNSCEYSVTYPMTDESDTRLSRLVQDHNPTTSAASPSTGATYGAIRPTAPTNRFAPEVQISIAGDAADYQGLTFDATFSRSSGPLITDCSPDTTVTYVVGANGFVYGQSVTVGGNPSTDVREVAYPTGGGATITDRAPWLIGPVTGRPQPCGYTVTFDNLVAPVGEGALPRLILRQHLDPDTLGAHDTPAARVHRVNPDSPDVAVTYGPVVVTYGAEGLAGGPVAFTPATIVATPEGMFAPDVSISLPTGNNGRNYEFAGAQFEVTFSRESGPANGCSPDVTVTYAAANTVSEKVSANHRAFIYGQSVSGTDAVLETGYVLHGVEEPVIDKTPWLIDVPDGEDDSCVYSVSYPANEVAAANQLTRVTIIDLDTGEPIDNRVSASAPKTRALYRRTTMAGGGTTFTPAVTLTVPQVTQARVPASAGTINRFHGLTFEVTFNRSGGPATGCSNNVTGYFAINENGTIDDGSPELIDSPHDQTGNCEYTVTFSAGNLLCAKPGDAVGTELERFDVAVDECANSRYNGMVAPRLTLNTNSGLVTTTSAASPDATATYEALEQTFTPDITVELPTPNPADEFNGRTFTVSFTPTTLEHDLAPLRECTTDAADAVFTVGSNGTITETTAAPTLIGYAADHAGECVYTAEITGSDTSKLEFSLAVNRLTVRPRFPDKTFTYLRPNEALTRDGMFLPQVSLVVIPPAPADSSEASQNAIAEMFMGETFRVTFSRSSGPVAGCSPDVTVTYKVARGFHQPTLGANTLNSYFVYGDTVEGTSEVSEDYHQWHWFRATDTEVPGSNAEVNGRRVLRNRTPYLMAGPDDNPCVYSVSYPETEEGGTQFALVPRAVVDGVEQTEFSTVTYTVAQRDEAIAVCGLEKGRPEGWDNAINPTLPVPCTVNFLDTETSAANPVTGAVYEVNTGPVVTIDSTARATFVPAVTIAVPQVTAADVNSLLEAGTLAGDANAFAGRSFDVQIQRTGTSMDYCNVYVDWTPSLESPNEATLLWNQDTPFRYVVQPDGSVVNQTQVAGLDGADDAQFTLGGQAPFLVADDNCDYTVSFSATETGGSLGNPRLGRTTANNVPIDADNPAAQATYTAPQTTFTPNISINISGDATAYSGVSINVSLSGVARTMGKLADCSASESAIYTVQSNGSITGSAPAMIGFPEDSPLDCAYQVSVSSTAGSGATALVLYGPGEQVIEDFAQTGRGSNSASFTYRAANTFEPNVAIQLPGGGAADVYEGKQFTVTFTPTGASPAGCSTGVSAMYEVEVSTDGNFKFVVGKTVTGTDDINEYSFTIGGIEVRGREVERSGTTGTVVETNSSLPERWAEVGFITADTTDLTINGELFSGGNLNVLERTLLTGATPIIGGATFTESEPRLINVPHGQSASCTYTVTFPLEADGLTVTHVDGQVINRAASNPDLTVDVSAASPMAAARYSAYSFKPTVTLTVPDVTETVSWTYDPDGPGGEPAQTGTEMNVFVGKRLTVTFEAAAGAPSGCTQKVIAILVVRYDGSVTGPMPSLITAPPGATRLCEYEVTFAMGDTPLDPSIFTQKAPGEDNPQHVGGACLWTPPRPATDTRPADTVTAANNYCEDEDGNKVREPASASATNAEPGSRLRRDGAPTATVSATSASATATYTAPALTFDAAPAVSASVPDATYTQFTFDVAISVADGISATGCSADTQMTFTVGGNGEVTVASTMLNSYGANSPDPCIYALSFPSSIGSGTQKLAPAGIYVTRHGWVEGPNPGDDPVWTAWNYLAAGAGSAQVRVLQEGVSFETFRYVTALADDDVALPSGPHTDCGDDPATAPDPCQQRLQGDHFVPFVNIVAPPETTVNAAGERVSVYAGLSFEVTFRAAAGSPSSGCDTVTATYFITENGTTLTDGGTPNGGVFVPVVDEATSMQLTRTVNGVEHPVWKIVQPRLVGVPSGETTRCIYDVIFPDTDTNPTHTGFDSPQHTAHGSLELTAGTPRRDDNTKFVGRQVQKSVDAAQWNRFGGDPETATATYSAKALTVGIELHDRWLIRDTGRVDENNEPIGERIKWDEGGTPAAHSGKTFTVTIGQADGVPTNDGCSDDTTLTLTVAANGTIASGDVDLIAYAPDTLHLCRYAVTVPESLGPSNNALGIVNQRHSEGWLERSWPDPALRAVTGFTTGVTFYYAPLPAGEAQERPTFVPSVTFNVPFVDANRDSINDLRGSEIVVTYTLAASQGTSCDVGMATAADGSRVATQRYVVGRSGWRITGHTLDQATNKRVPNYEYVAGDTGNEVTLQTSPRDAGGLRTTDGEAVNENVGGPDLSRVVGALISTADDGTTCNFEVSVSPSSLRGLYGATFDLDQSAPVTINDGANAAAFTYSGTSMLLVHVDITVPAYDVFGGDLIARDDQGNPIVNTADERRDEFDHFDPRGRHIGQQVRSASFFRDGVFPVRFARSAGPATGCSDMTVNYVVLADGRVVPPGNPPTPPRLIDVPPNQPGGATEACVYTATFPDTVNSVATSADAWTLTGTGMGTVTVGLIDTDQSVTWNPWIRDADGNWACATPQSNPCTGTPGQRVIETDADTTADDIWSVSRTYAMGATEFTPAVAISIQPGVFQAGGNALTSVFAGAQFEVTITRSGGPTRGCSEGSTPGSPITLIYTVQTDGTIASATTTLVDRPLGATASCEYTATLPASVASGASVSPAWTLNMTSDGATTRDISVAARSVAVTYSSLPAGSYFLPDLRISVPEYSYVNSDAAVAATPTTSGARSASFFEDGVIGIDFTPTASSPSACPTYVGQPYVVLVDGTVWPLAGAAPALVDLLDGEAMACSYTVNFPDTFTSETTADARVHPVAYAQDPAASQVEPERTWTLTGATVAAQVVSSMAPMASRSYEISTTSFRPLVSVQVPPFDDENDNNVFAGHTFDVTFSRSGGPTSDCSADTTAVFTVQNDGTVTGTAPMLIDKPATASGAEGCEYEVGYPATATAPSASPFDWDLDVNSATAPVVQVEVTRAERAAAGEPIGVQASRFYTWGELSYSVDWTFRVPPHPGTGANAGRNAYAGDTFTLALAPGAEAGSGCSSATSTTYTVQSDGSVTPQGGSGPTLIDRVAAVVDPASSFIDIPNFCYYDVTLTSSNAELMLRRSVTDEKMAMSSRVATVRYQLPGTTFEPSATVRVPFVDDNGDGNNDLAGETVTVTYTQVTMPEQHEECSTSDSETYTVDAAESSTPGIGTATRTGTAASLVDRPAGEDDQCQYAVTLAESAALATAAPAKSADPAVIRDGVSTAITYLTATAFTPMVSVVVPFIDDGAGANTLATETVTVTYTPVSGSHQECMSGMEAYTVGTAESSTARQGVTTVGTAASLVDVPSDQSGACRYTVSASASAGLSDALPARIVQSLSATEIAAGVAVTITYTAPTRFTPTVTVVVPFIDADEDSNNDLIGQTVMVTFTPVSGSHGHCAGGTATYTVDTGGTAETGGTASVTAAVELIDQPAQAGAAACRYTISLSQSQVLSEQARGRRVSPAQIGAGVSATVTYSVRSERLPAPPRPGASRTTVVSTPTLGPASGGSGTASGVGSDIDDAPADGENPFAGFVPAPLDRVPVSVAVTVPQTMIERGEAMEILVSSPGVCGSDLAAFGGVPAGIGLAYGVGAQPDETIEIVSAGAFALPAFAERGSERRPCALRVTVLTAPEGCTLANAQTDAAGRGYVELEWNDGAESLDLTPAFTCGEPAGAPADSAPSNPGGSAPSDSSPEGGAPADGSSEGGAPAEPAQASLPSRR